ncbi:hypothetical protein GCM10009665_67090 [Kitasatospora nipponensis]|uniref:HTH araC/xylS-type domain-containing protein n=1 Tax=Kitasatospora nipponensis TaxID=258049 RepID=A0ABN1WYP5_9ACTN
MTSPPHAEPAGPDQIVDEAVQGRPAPALRRYVAWYSGYRQRGVAPMRHRGLPSPYLTLILTLDDPLTVRAHPDPAAAPAEYRALLGGLHTSPALITHQGRQSGVQIALSPLGARVLLGLPAGELAGQDFAAEQVLGGWAGEGRERLCAAPDRPARFAAVDHWLLTRLLGATRPSALSPEVVRAWRLLLDGGGRPSAAALAREVGWSGRHLAGRFRTEIGLTPKAAARVVRFDRARRLLAARAVRPRRPVAGPMDLGEADPGSLYPGPMDLGAADPGAADPGAVDGGAVDGGAVDGGLGLARLAAHCGYFDQAHLAREFRALAGCPPSRWLAEEVLGSPAAAGPVAAGGS